MKITSKYHHYNLAFFNRRILPKILTIALVFVSGVILAQTKEVPSVTINMNNEPLEAIFSKLEQLSGYEFSYGGELRNNKKTYTVNYQGIALNDILNRLSKQASFKFKIQNKKILIQQQENKKVNGKITDKKTGEPLVGATIRIKGTTQGTIADVNGSFTLEIPNDKVVFEVTFVGYLTQEISFSGQSTIEVQLQQDITKIDEIVVTGYRQSLQNALAIKKLNANVVDAIVAEDMAKFPQSNMAEALQRVSGIQIRRDDAGGVGNEVSIRGLPSEYTQVTVDGDAVPNNNDGRNYNFNTLPAEAFGKVEVKKSPTAKDTEGGIGGTVNLVTRKPFELSSQTFVASVEGIYNTQQQEGNSVTPKISLAYGNKWDKFGFIAGVFFHKFFNTSEGYDITRYYNESYDLDGDGINEYENIRVPRPRYVSQGQEVDRFSANLSLQYAFTDRFNVVFDGLFVKNDQVQTRYTPIWFLPGDSPTFIETNGKQVQSITYREATAKLENQQQTNKTTNSKFSIKGKWNIGRGWKLGAKIGHAFNKRDAERFRYYADNKSTVSFSIKDNHEFFELKTPTDFSNANHFYLSQSRRYQWDNQDEIFMGKLDLSKKINNQFNIDFGGSYRDRTKTQEYFFRRDKTLNEPFYPVAKLLTGFMDNVSEAKGFDQFLVHDWDKSYELYGSKLDLTNYKVNNASYDINEKIYAGYAQGNLKINKLELNAGLRFVHTGLTSQGYELDDNTNVFEVREVKNNYKDFLPSVNLKYEPMKDFVVRASFARVITRPSLQDLSSYRVIDDVNKRITAKNPELDPFRANQYDVSLEWYPKKEILISGAVFVKDIESFISRQTSIINFDGEEYELRQPVNGNNAIIKGVELNYQQPFTFLPSPFDGLGVVANYTLSLSDFKEKFEDGSSETYSLPNNSKHSYNLIGYYEKYNFSLRVAYNYRSSFLREIPNPEDGLKYRDGMGITDISSSYKIKENITLTLNILNAFNSKKYEYIFDEQYMDNVSFFGQTIQLGLRVKL